MIFFPLTIGISKTRKLRSSKRDEVVDKQVKKILQEANQRLILMVRG